MKCKMLYNAFVYASFTARKKGVRIFSAEIKGKSTSFTGMVLQDTKLSKIFIKGHYS